MPVDSTPDPARLRLLSDLVDHAFATLDDAAELAGELGMIRTRDHLRHAVGMAGAASAVVELRQRSDAPAVLPAEPLCATSGCGHLVNVHTRALAGSPAYCDVVDCWCAGYTPTPP